MQQLEVSCAVRRFFKSLGFKGLIYSEHVMCFLVLATPALRLAEDTAHVR